MAREGHEQSRSSGGIYNINGVKADHCKTKRRPPSVVLLGPAPWYPGPPGPPGPPPRSPPIPRMDFRAKSSFINLSVSLIAFLAPPTDDAASLEVSVLAALACLKTLTGAGRLSGLIVIDVGAIEGVEMVPKDIVGFVSGVAAASTAAGVLEAVGSDVSIDAVMPDVGIPKLSLIFSPSFFCSPTSSSFLSPSNAFARAICASSSARSRSSPSICALSFFCAAAWHEN